MDIQKVSGKEMEAILETRIPLGKFLCEDENHVWTAVDNNTGDAWTECFLTEERARQWLGNTDLEIPSPEGWEYD